MKIQILGTGCAKCRKLYESAELAAEQLGIDYELEKVEDITAIVAMGAMMTPALAVDGEIKVSGKVPSIEGIKQLLLQRGT